MNSLLEHNISFGEFELDVEKRRLMSSGEPVALNSKTFDLLAFLAGNRGRVVSKDEILDSVWAGQFVEEANLSVQISALRKALGEKKETPRFLITVPGKGYKFVADVHEHGDEFVIESHRIERTIIDEQIDGGDPGDLQRISAAPPKSKAAVLVPVAAGLLLLFGFVANRFLAPSPAPPIRSIAVLPFKPLVADSRNESLELGMADTLIAKLSNLQEVTVRPITAVRKYSGLEQDAVAAGHEQQVDAVLDGQIQQSGDKIRMTARLVRVADGTTVWTSQFDEKMADIFRLQDSISSRVAEELVLKLSGDQKNKLSKRDTDNTEAYELYLLGRFHFAKRTRESVARSIEYFQQAVEKDANYALAHTALGAAYAVSGWSDFLAPHDAYPKAKAAIAKAIQMDDSIAEAYAVSANVKRAYDWDLTGAEIEHKRAVELEPNNATAYHWYGMTLAFAGRHDESIALMERARQLDPLSLIINKSLGDAYSFARRFDEAIVQYKKVLELDPAYPNAYREMGTCYVHKGLEQEGVQAWLKAAALSGFSPAEIDGLRAAYTRSGIPGIYRTLAEKVKSRDVQYLSAYDVSGLYSAAGDKEEALDWLERAYQDHSSGMVAIDADLWFDNIRSEPRFIDIRRRVGLPAR
jgi:DNA-binding winged helix-turn-helix (wHTH) protein/TolB-like protein/Flp pilus assembly protein TadD